MAAFPIRCQWPPPFLPGELPAREPSSSAAAGGYFPALHDGLKARPGGWCPRTGLSRVAVIERLSDARLSEEQERLILAHAEMVMVMLDGDEAGRKGMEEISWRLAKHIWTRVSVVPEGRQPDQMSTEELQALLEK